MTAGNDFRGWILTAISGVACCAGASIICVDVIVRRFPRMHNFKIAESDAFLSASLSLSAGVILFSSLYVMLPESRDYLKRGGYSPRPAAFLLIGLFLVGVFGIRVLSQIMHKFIPSHIVDCDHKHDEESNKTRLEEMSEHGHDEPNGFAYNYSKSQELEVNQDTEATPLLSQTHNRAQMKRTTSEPAALVNSNLQTNVFATAPSGQRTSSTLGRTLSRTFSKYVTSKKDECDEDGPCMGFSDPCGQDCFKIVQRRGNAPLSYTHSKHQAIPPQRALSDFRIDIPVPEGNVPDFESAIPSHSQHKDVSRPALESLLSKGGRQPTSSTHHYHHTEHEHTHQHRGSSQHQNVAESHDHMAGADHHHHVPTNAFISIGLQTSVAIALHKAPEGFITYATNHANPRLGFSVFIALFIHNLTEGFALSLPLFLALNSRLKAILWASVLGGLSQPLGAGVAALWFKLSSNGGSLAPDEKVYGGLFAITSGIMASVGLSLLSESLQLSHSRNTCIAFAFLGMGILGVSNALTAH